MPLILPEPQTLPTPRHEHVQSTDNLQLQEVSQSCSSRPLPSFLWIGQEPGLTQLPHHATPPPCPGSRKEDALEDLRVSSLRAWPHREREGWRTPTTWPEDLGGGVDEAQGSQLPEPITPRLTCGRGKGLGSYVPMWSPWPQLWSPES